MPISKVVLLACGSFNPPTNMHMRMFEIARDHLARLGHEVIGGIISPVHDSYGKKDLVSSTHRNAMVKIALSDSSWVKLSEWETHQEGWTQTRKCIEYHQKCLLYDNDSGFFKCSVQPGLKRIQFSNYSANRTNQVNAVVCNSTKNDYVNDNEFNWIPEDVRINQTGPVKVKLLCGGDLLESFGTPGLWADEDIEAIVGHHGLVVITRKNTDPLQFIYNSDVLTKYMANIIIVTEWITNEVSSTKIRRALRRNESVKYLIPDKVINYIYKHNLYGSKETKYLFPPVYNSAFLTPSPSDVMMDSPSPTNNRCLIICDKDFFSNRTESSRMAIDMVDGVSKSNFLNTSVKKHPGQAMKVITTTPGQHKTVTIDVKKEVCAPKKSNLKSSKSLADFEKIEKRVTLASSKSNNDLQDCKSCDENLIKFIFTKHGIQVISDVETIV